MASSAWATYSFHNLSSEDATRYLTPHFVGEQQQFQNQIAWLQQQQQQQGHYSYDGGGNINMSSSSATTTTTHNNNPALLPPSLREASITPLFFEGRPLTGFSPILNNDGSENNMMDARSILTSATPENVNGFGDDLDPASLPPPPPPPGSPPPEEQQRPTAPTSMHYDGQDVDGSEGSPLTARAIREKKLQEAAAHRAQYLAQQEALALQRAKEAEAASSARAARRERRAPPTPLAGEAGEESTDASSAVALHRRSSRARALEFEGPEVEADLARILTVDTRGCPLAAVPIVNYATEQNLTMEGLLNTVAQVGQHNTAVRAWIKGDKLGRPSVRIGAAYILEWYDALMENRPRRNMIVVDKAGEFLTPIKAPASSLAKRGFRGRPKATPSTPVGDGGDVSGGGGVVGEEKDDGGEPSAKRVKETKEEEEEEEEEEKKMKIEENEHEEPTPTTKMAEVEETSTTTTANDAAEASSL